MVTAHDLHHRVETNINDIYRDYSPTHEAHYVAHDNIHRSVIHATDAVVTEYIHMYGEHEMPDAAVDDLANDIDTALVEIVSESREYAAITRNPVDAAGFLENNRDEVVAAYEVHGDGDDSPIAAVNAWNLACAEKVAQHWESKINWLYDSLTAL